jgi:hypothetical protein
MSAIGFFGSTALESMLSRATQNGSQKFKQGFQQLGQDLQSGNVSQAKSDLAALQIGPSALSSASPSSSSVSQAFNQIAQDLQSGNLTAAQSDYTTLGQNLQRNSIHGAHLHSHSTNSSNTVSQSQQELSELGQALKSGSLSGAQQAYTSLQAELTPFAGSSNSPSSSTGAGVNVSA